MPEISYSPQFQARHAQTFPVLAPEEIARLRPFGVAKRFAAGTLIYETGKPSQGFFVVLSGTLRITARDGHGNVVPVVDHGVGGFGGELGQLSGQRAFVDGLAVGDVEGLLVTPENLRALLVAEAVLGEKITRALILRRVALIESGFGGPVLIGPAEGHDVARLQSFLGRNGIPHLLLDPAVDPEARAFSDRHAREPSDLPLALCPDGSVLRNPTENELAKCIGMLDSEGAEGVYDVVVVGAGPAGLATAVYAASEGLSVLVIDARAFGGQAGASARIENYLGFPTGISGMALAGRAHVQAQKFGARMQIPAEVVSLTCEAAGPVGLTLADGRAIRSRTVVIASGARYRRPECANLKAMEGHGVWYWASPVEAKLCAGQELALVGGGNSAGQAAVFLSAHAARVSVLVRGEGLAASMSRYLIDRIAAAPNIELLTRTEIVCLEGSPKSGVESVTWRHRETRREEIRPIRNVFMFLGADPRTEWLRGCDVAVDEKGFVRTGTNSGLPLETTVRGVFAIGDVRSGSVKRVGAAIGEGAAVVAQIHAFIESQARA